MENLVNNWKKENLIKIRDDDDLVKLTWDDSDSPFFKADDSAPAWYKKNDDGANCITINDLRSRVEPWLTALFQSEHLSILIGSRLTTSVSFIAEAGSATGMNFDGFKNCKDIFDAQIQSYASAAGRDKPNIEDYIRFANELLRGLEILNDSRKDDLREEINSALESFANSILSSERNIVVAGKSVDAFNYLISFLMSFASRSGTRDRLNIFTTNYDRIIEEGADLAGLHLLDRFVGRLNPIFRSSRLNIDMHYNPPGIRGEPRYLEGVARYTKLHGSVDWIQVQSEKNTQSIIRKIGLPLGAENVADYLKAPGLYGADALKMMIYPNAAKDRETAMYPYVDLFRDFAATTCKPNSTLVTYGYSFGDEHINRIIEDMLTIPSTHLVIIAFEDPQNRIINTYNEIGRKSQISLLLGHEFGDLKKLVDNYLPKSAIDKTTYKLGEILKNRHLVSNHTTDVSNNSGNLKNGAESSVGEVEE